MAKQEVDEKALEAELLAWEQEKAKKEEALAGKRKALASKKFDEVKALVEQYGKHFDSKHKKALVELLGLNSPKTKNASTSKRTASDKPKKYRLPTGEEWGGQGGDKMAPTAFKQWRAKNPKTPWPSNPAYTA